MGVLDDLRAAIDALLLVDPTDLDHADLHALSIGTQRELSRLELGAARVTATWDERQLWASNGSRSAAHRLARETRRSVASCRRQLAAAHATITAPIVAQAVADGALSIDHLHLLAGVADGRHELFARDEALLVDRCRELDLADASKAARYWADAADDEMDLPPPVSPEGRAYRSTVGDQVVLEAVLPTIAGEIVTGELDRLEAELRSRPPDDRVRTAAQWRALALVEMATRSATTAADGRRPKPLFIVHVGEATFEWMCETAAGQIIHPNTVLPWLTEADYRTMVFDDRRTLITASRARSFTGTLRQVIEARDLHCQHESGCDVAADRCDVDHIVPHSHGGPTDQFNGRLGCTTHNRRPDRRGQLVPPPRYRHPDAFDDAASVLGWQLRHIGRRRPPPTARPRAA